MRLTLGAVLCAALAFSCSETSEKRPTAAFDEKKFVQTTLEMSRSNVDLAAMAQKKGRLPATRQLGSTLQQQMTAMTASLGAVARRTQTTIPAAPPEKRVALRDNLQTLPGQVFDRGYTLAMLQDLNGMSATFRRAAKSGNPEIAAFARHYTPVVDQLRDEANRALEAAGGSPFGFVPK